MELNRQAFLSAIWAAENENADCLVFILDSSGGTMEDARQISRVIQDAPSSLRVCVYVKRAVGASVWLLASSDVLLFSPSSATGAAMSFFPKSGPSSSKNDADEYAAIASEIAGIAESHGQPSEVYRAMVDPSASLWSGVGPYGRLIFQQSPPIGLEDIKMWDSADTVLAITASEAEELMLGVRAGVKTDEIADALNISNAIVVRGPEVEFLRNSRLVPRGVSKLERADKQIDRLLRQISDKYDVFTERERTTESLKPSAWNSDLKYSARYRASHLERIKRYRDSLYELQELIEAIASLHKKVPPSVRSRDSQAVALNELVGYSRFLESDASVNDERRLKLEIAWDMTTKELKWCKDQE